MGDLHGRLALWGSLFFRPLGFQDGSDRSDTAQAFL